MPTIAEIFQDLATKAGIPSDNEHLKAIVTDPFATKATVPDELASSFAKGLHSIDSAKATLMPQFRAEVYNGIDARLFEMIPEFGLADEDLAEVKAADKTTEKIKLIANKIKSLESKKAGAANGDKNEYIKQINDLKAAQATLQTQKEQEIASVRSQAEVEMNDFAVRNYLLGFDYVNDGVDKGVNAITAKTLLDQEVAKLNGTYKYDKTTGGIKLLKQDGTELYNPQNNTRLEWDSFSKGILAEKKMLKVTDPSKKGNGDGDKKIPGGDPSAANGLALVDELLKEQGFKS